MNSHLIAGWRAGGFEIHAVTLFIERHHRIAIGSSIGHGCVRDTVLIFGSRPPTATDRHIDDVVMWLLSIEPIFFTEEHVAMIMRVP